MNEDGIQSSLGELAKKLAGRTAKRRATAADRVAEAWAAAVGPALADVTRVRSVRDGTAVVATLSAPLCHELASFRREALLAALNERLAAAKAPPVTALVFRIGAG